MTEHLHFRRRKWQPTPVFLPGESQGRGSLVGCCLWGRTESDLAAAAADYSLPGSSVKWNFPSKNTGVSCYSLFQGIFQTQGSNLHLLHWQKNSLPLSHLGSHDSSETNYKRLKSGWWSNSWEISTFPQISKNIAPTCYHVMLLRP